MKRITLKLTVEEISLLASLASDQLFRREFIDPRMPGYKSNPAEVSFGKALVVRLRAVVDQDLRDSAAAPVAVAEFAPAGPPKRTQ
jgi:hypothetical protein